MKRNLSEKTIGECEAAWLAGDQETVRRVVVTLIRAGDIDDKVAIPLMKWLGANGDKEAMIARASGSLRHLMEQVLTLARAAFDPETTNCSALMAAYAWTFRLPEEWSTGAA